MVVVRVFDQLRTHRLNVVFKIAAGNAADGNHTFRHTCATAMLRNKAGVRTIQKLLGHSSLDSTQIYTRVSITDLKEVHQRCHPREKDKE
jgi:site-specific recombinase XerD